MKTKKKPIPSIFSTGTEDDICVYCKEYRNRPDPKGRFTINATFMGLPACHSCRMSYFLDGEYVQKRMIAIKKPKHRMYCAKSGMRCAVYHPNGICPDVRDCEACNLSTKENE